MNHTPSSRNTGFEEINANGRVAASMIRLEHFSLFAFAFVLPLFEAPKNLLWVVYVVVWLTNRWRARDVGGAWDRWDTLILVWIASGYVSAMFAGLHHKEWLSAFDILRYGSVLWLLRRSGYSEVVLGGLLAWLIAGTLAGLAWGFYGVHVTRHRYYLGLNSVGHVNHSAIYLAILYGAAIAWLRAAWNPKEGTKNLLGLVLCLLLGLALVEMQSRATVGVGFFVGFLIVCIYAMRSGKPVWIVVVGTILVAAAIFAAQPEVVRKNSARLHQNLILTYRDSIWRAGIIGWRQYPVFGVGMGNYGRIDLGLLKDWSRAQGASFDPARVLPQSHAHSLYVNTLTERGFFGLSVLLAVLAAWGWTLARNIPERSDSTMRWAYWGGALSAWLVTLLVGAVNTTLHHEHALVSMLFLGGWLALKRNRKTAVVSAAKHA